MFSLLRAPERLSATMQVAGVFFNVAAIMLAAYLFFSLDAAGTIGATAVLILVMLIFVEIVPRIYASQNALRVFSRSSLLLLALQKILHPLTYVLLRSASSGRGYLRKKQNISIINDLSDALEKTSETSESENILKGIVKFGHILVHTIMTPRTDVESVDITIGLTELIAKINEWGYSRIPVHDGAPDNVKGILCVKDLIPYIDEVDDFHWQKLIRDAHFVPENKKIDDLLNEFQSMKIHLAVIIDEYGGTVGIVTLEDILEEIVGDIADESDDDESDYVKLDENTYLFDGKVLLNDFFRITQLNESYFDEVKGEADTLAGVILEMKGEIPQKGDTMDFKHLAFSMEAADNRRIKQIKVVIHEK